MGLIDATRTLLREVPMQDILRERLSLAVDRLEDLEAKVEELQTEKGSLQGQLEIERREHARVREELQQLEAAHEEEIRIHCMIEFRRGKRTGGQWAAFCPKCHLPVTEIRGRAEVQCTGCDWFAPLEGGSLSKLSAYLQ